MRSRLPGFLPLIIIACIAAAALWFIRCGYCVNLRSFSPHAIRDYIQSFGRLAVLVYIAIYVLNTISVLPPIGTLSLSSGLVFGAIQGGIYLELAAMIGTSATFFISRYAGRSFVERALKGKIKDFDERLRQKGFLTVLFFRVVPILPYEFLNYACGLTSISFQDYFWATLLGLAPGVCIAAFFGSSIGEIKTVHDLFMPRLLIAAGLMGLIILVPVAYLAIIHGRKKSKKSGEKSK